MNPARRVLAGAGFVLAYVALDWVSFMYELTPVGITPWNPPPGLALAFLLVAGPVMAPLVMAGAVAADLVVRDLPAPLLPTLTSALVIGGVYAVTAEVLRRWLRLDAGLSRLRDVFALMAAAAAAAALVGAAYVAISIDAGLLPSDQFMRGFRRYWIGDMIGVVVTTPAILVLLRRGWRRPGWRVAVEAAAQTASLAAILWLVFGLAELPPFRLFYLLFLPLIWISVRFGLVGATLGNLAAQVGLIAAFQVVDHEPSTVTAFQFLMLALAGTTLVLGAAISERRRVEVALHARQTELAQLARLSMAGEMAAALAHELNQPLLAAIAFTRAAQRMLAGGGDAAKAAGAMDRAVQEAQRAGDIIRTLREFIGKDQIHSEAHPPARLVGDALALVAPECARAGIRLVAAVDKALPLVQCDKVQVQQVLLNLVRNAMEAPAAARAGASEISVVARPVQGAVEFDVGDNGPGVADEVAERLFEPFNTTKPTGMGLGLTISRGFVEAQGGRLALAANGPRGAVFRFTLPVADDQGESRGRG